MGSRVFVTGGAGFVGQWLAKRLLARGDSVFCGTLTGEPDTRVLTAAERRRVCWIDCDVTSDESIAAALAQSKPQWIVHLAGIAFAPDANASPLKAFDINALGAMRLLRAVQENRGVRVLVVGSAEEYGAQKADAYPIAEDAILRPLTPYAVAKASQELIALQSFRAFGTDVVCTRSFNHSGVGHGDSYLLPTLVRRVRELDAGEPLRIGNGDVLRDYLHVSDVVEAYIRLLESGRGGEVYNVSSGTGTTVRDLAKKVLARSGKTADISSDAALLRPIDVPILIGDSSRLRKETGWSPSRSVDDIIDDLLNAPSR